MVSFRHCLLVVTLTRPCKGLFTFFLNTNVDTLLVRTTDSQLLGLLLDTGRDGSV